MKKLLIAAAAALTAYGVYRLVREDGSPDEGARIPDVPIPFGRFLEDRVTVDRLDGRMLADWARPRSNWSVTEREASSENSPLPPALQNMQPPVPRLPSLLGQVKFPESEIL